MEVSCIEPISCLLTLSDGYLVLNLGFLFQNSNKFGGMFWLVAIIIVLGVIQIFLYQM